MAQPILQVKNVSKVYKMDGVSITALQDVSLEIKKGEFVALVGPSGSGKSTLMHLIGALDTPSSGEVIIDNKNISNLSETELARIRNQKVGFVFQQFNLLPRISAVHNVEIPLIYASITNNQKRREKGDRLENHPNQLSGGQQQRVAIARALINNPSIILADEPTGNVDSKTGTQIMQIFKRLHREGNTIVMVTHEKKLAKQTQRQIYIKDGQMVKKL
jgi:putative ABC transport system ATP-binding protein